MTQLCLSKELKWRTELFKVFITEMQKESINKDSFIDNSIFNLIIVCKNKYLINNK